jgi:ribosome biogenesis protein BMS1
VTGPITVVSGLSFCLCILTIGKHRRLTFIECPNDLNSMIDITKTADLTLLLIDASFGFEMETMEYLNILSSHGMTRIFGILTHLDLIKKVATVRAVKKRLKHRFWTEIYDGAKLFYLSGVLNGRYPDREIMNLSRFISVLKFRPLRWKMSHPYVVADRMEELTLPQDIEDDPLCDRTITLYGYQRGTNLSANEPRVHIPGVGDFTVSQVSGLPDPCPSPSAVAKERGAEGGKIKRRSLSDKQKLIYAPMSDVGGVMFDKDAVYITVPDKQSFTRREDGEEDDEEAGVGERLVMRLQESRNGLGAAATGLRLFSEGEELTGLPEVEENGDSGRKERRRPGGKLNAVDLDDLDEENEDDEDDDDDGDDEVDGHSESGESDRGVVRLPGDSSDEDEDVAFAESDSDMGEPDSEDELPSSLRWKENLSERASALYSGSRRIDLNRLIYGDEPIENVVRQWREYTGVTVPDDEEENIEDEDEEMFFKKAPDDSQIVSDGSLPQYSLERLQEWKDVEKINSLKHRFVTADMLEEGEDEAAEAYGDFEDLEEKDEDAVDKEKPEEPLDLEAERAANAKRKEELRLRFEEAEENPDNSDSEKGEETWGDQQKAKIQKQLEINKREFEGLDAESRVKVEGYLPGTYVRMVLHGIPCEFVERFDPRFPVVVGGLLNDEQRFGYIQVSTDGRVTDV